MLLKNFLSRIIKRPWNRNRNKKSIGFDMNNLRKGTAHCHGGNESCHLNHHRPLFHKFTMNLFKYALVKTFVRIYKSVRVSTNFLMNIFELITISWGTPCFFWVCYKGASKASISSADVALFLSEFLLFVRSKRNLSRSELFFRQSQIKEKWKIEVP